MNTSADNSQLPESQIQPKSNNKLIWFLLAILIVVIVAAGIWNFMSLSQSNKTAENTTNTPTTTAPTTDNATTNTTAIKNDIDLQSASADLDSANVDSIDTTLTQNDTDVSQF